MTSSLSHQHQMPTWFIPHGGGPCFFMYWNPPDAWNKMADFLKNLSKTLPTQPRAILMVSAHWLGSPVSVTGGNRPNLIYDYYGFPEHTYALEYPAKGDPNLASSVVNQLKSSNIDAVINPERGFDHGMFIPMMLMFPKADIPVIQLSLNQNLDPQTHLQLGAALEPFRKQGLLIIGSGMSFHNMRGYGNPQFAPISDAFDEWLTHVVESNADERNQALMHWEQAPFARLCHPPRQEEHLLPLMVIAGAASKSQGRKVFSDRVMETTLSAFIFE
jgi:aromatic ring-opening dioxygenase catalytic subunit (LigB family)